MIKLHFTVALLALIVLPNAQAQAQNSEVAQPSLYAVSAAGLASAMTYCSTKYGNLTKGSLGEACFSKARGLLAGQELKKRAQEIDQRCTDKARFNTCLTPEIGRLVYALNAEFVKQGL